MIFIKELLNRFRSSHPEHHAIARGMVWVALFVLFGKIVGAAKEMVVAWRYGVSADVDAYTLVFNMVSWPVGVWFGVLTIVLIPLVANIKQLGVVEIYRFRSELFGLSILLGLILTLITAIGFPLLLRSSWVSLSDHSLVAALRITPKMAPLAFFGILISLFSVWMLAAEKHTNTLLESVPAMCILAALLLVSGGGVQPLVWGTLIGFVLHLSGLFIPLARSGEINFPRFSYKSTHWPLFWKGFGVMWVGQMLMSFTVILDQLFAGKIAVGAIATLSYSNRILGLILGLGAVAISRAMLPVFSKAQSTGSEKLSRIAFRWVGVIFFLGSAAALIAWTLAPLGVRLLFERGAFTPQNTIEVAEVFRYGLFQLPFYMSNIVMVSLLASKGKYKVIAALASANLVINLAALIVLTPVLGVRGIPISTSIMYGTTFLLLCIVVRKEN